MGGLVVVFLRERHKEVPDWCRSLVSCMDNHGVQLFDFVGEASRIVELEIDNANNACCRSLQVVRVSLRYHCQFWLGTVQVVCPALPAIHQCVFKAPTYGTAAAGPAFVSTQVNHEQKATSPSHLCMCVEHVINTVL